MKFRNVIVACSAVVGLAVGAQTATATEYTFSSFLGPNHQITRFMHIPWAEAIKKRTNGAIDFKVYVGGTILPGTGVLQGIAQGVAQGGFVTAGYVPAEMPVWNIIGDLGWRAKSDYAVTLAATEFGILNSEGHGEWQKNGVVFAGSASTPLYNYECRGTPHTLADFKGLRIRTAGNGWARFAEYIGAVPVNVAYTETYSALQRGALDCANLDPTHMYDGAQLAGVINSVIKLPMGPFFSQAVWAFNKDFWKGLTKDEKRIIFEESARAIVRLHQKQDAMVADNYKQAAEHGIKVLEPGPKLVEAKDKFVANDIGGLSKIAEERHVPDYKKAIKDFSDLLAKWDKLLASADRSNPDAMYKLIMTNIYDKIDLNTYGTD